MRPGDFGVYVMTYPGDFHLSTVLVRSIQQVNPDIPIMIIPGEGFDLDDHPFDVPVMPLPTTGFWAQIGHQDRDFWAFQGPFENFLYLDADTICTKTLEPLAQRTAGQEGNFIYVQPWLSDEDWRARLENSTHPQHESAERVVSRDIGRGPLAEFDPEHDFWGHRSFNSGAFASRRLTISESDLEALNEAERRFYRDVLHEEDWSWRSSQLFFRDQGRLNYLVRKLSIPVYPIAPELRCLPGASAIELSFEDVNNDRCNFHIIHWMGAKSPSPSLFCVKPLFPVYAYLWSVVGEKNDRYIMPGYKKVSECVGFSLWRHYHEQLFGIMSLGTRLRWSYPDMRRTLKLLIRWLKLVAGWDKSPRHRS
jgi:hypothetical protein